MRAFIGLDFDQNLKKKLLECQNIIKGNSIKGSWVRPDNFHCTLKFLGNIYEEKAEDIGKVLESISKEYYSISLNLDNIGYFNKRKNKYGVIWIGLNGEIKKLIKIYDIIEDSMVSLGYSKDKRLFRPHITLGKRVILGKPFDEIKVLTNSSINYSFELDNIVLMKSEEKMGKRIYTPTKSYNLLKNHR